MTQSITESNALLKRKLAEAAQRYHKPYPLSYFLELTFRGILAYIHPWDRIVEAKVCYEEGCLSKEEVEEIKYKIKIKAKWEL